MPLVVALCIGVSHKLIILTFITSLIRRVMLVPLAVVVLLSLPCFFFITQGSLVLSESAYLTKAAEGVLD